MAVPPKTRRPKSNRRFPAPARRQIEVVAKLAAPRIRRAHPRARLFRLLDGAGRKPVVWIEGAPGAGKTVLVASWLAARKRPFVWYQADAGDADPATFVHYLARGAPKKGRPLPPLTPEYLGGLETFARRFFEALFAKLARNAVLVLDNLHTVPDGALHEVLAAAFDSVPDGRTIVCISRAPPPAAFARFLVAERLACLPPAELALTPSETEALAKLLTGKRLSRECVERLHARTHGWAAGLVLLQQADTSSEGDTDPGAVTPPATFDYLAAEVFERAPKETQDLLLQTALFETFTAEMAVALTGEPRAAAILEDMQRRNYFTYRIAGQPPAFRYHPLLREFLLHRARDRFDPATWRRYARLACDILERDGAIDAAAEVAMAAEDHQALARLVVARAPTLAAEGRLQTLEHWISSLPAAQVETDGWLSYWLAVARLPFDSLAAHTLFERARAGFDARGDGIGVYLALAGVGQAMHFGADDSRAAALEWIALMERAESRFGARLPPEIEGPVALGALAALLVAVPEHPSARRWAERARALFPRVAAGDVQIGLAGFLAYRDLWVGDVAAARILVDSIRTRVGPSPPPSLAALMLACIEIITEPFSGRTGSGQRIAQEAFSMTRASGIHVLDSQLHGQACYAHGMRGDVTAMRAQLDSLQRCIRPGRDTSHYHFQASRLALLEGRLPDAVAHLEAAEVYCRQLGPSMPVQLTRFVRVEIEVAQGRYADARATLAAAEAYARETDSPMLLYTCGLLDTWLALHDGGEARAAEALAPALALGRSRGYLSHFSWSPPLMTPLCAAALRHGIEVDYVRHLIRTHALPPTADAAALDDWPFPVRIRTLGRFAVLIDDKALRFSTKAQKKPLDLLKALVALGGRGVREDALAEMLWPAAEADRAAVALGTTLHRLRRLIGEGAIERSEGRVSLDPSRCWVDVWAVERQCERIAQLDRTSAPEAIVGYVERLLALYRGSFLADQHEESWALSTRERLRGKFLRAMELAASVLSGAQRFPQAIQCLEKALEIDPLVESFYRGIMQAHLAQGQRAEALATYRRCCRLLARHLGLEPSPDTEALHRRILPN